MKAYLQNTRTGKIVPTKILTQFRPINDTFNTFINNLRMKIGEPTSQRKSNLSHTEYRGKRRVPITINCKTHAVEFTTDEYSVTFCPIDIQSIEIYKIEINKPKCGVGTKLMNLILDICDNMRIKCALIPVGEFINRFGKSTPTVALIRWYGSFGFKKNTLTHYFIYNPNLLKS